MRKLTFEGFLRTYLLELTGSTTQALARLVALATTEFPRSAEVVFLFASVRGKREPLLLAARTTRLHNEFNELAHAFPTTEKLLEGLQNGDGRLPARYHKVYQSYLNRLQRFEADRGVVLLMHKKTLTMMRQKKLSNYRVYTDLKLNPGNINAYLKNADSSKVSRKTARAIFEYAQTAKPQTTRSPRARHAVPHAMCCKREFLG